MLSARELEILVKEVGGILLGCRLKKIYGIPPASFVFRFHEAGTEDRNLVIALDSPLPRVNLVAERPETPRHPAPFVELLRRELKGARLKGMDTIPGDRVVQLQFEIRRGDGEPEARKVIVELLPALRNLIVTDASGDSVLCLRTGGSRRPQHVGQPYTPPDAPPPARPGRPAEDPFTFLDGRPPAAELFPALEADAIARESSEQQESLARVLRDGLRRARKRTARLQQKLEAELTALPDPEVLRRHGEILKVNQGQIPRGADSVRLPDWSAGTEEVIEIPLDPTRGARENVERLFKLAKKGDRARPRLASRLAECAARLSTLAELMERSEGETDSAVLETIAHDAREAGLLAETQRSALGAQDQRASKQKPKPEPGTRKPYRTFISRDDIEILVGRTAADNDTLTFRVARGNDYWFHVDGFPGSHVVVRADREIPPETLIDAATLAVHYSRAPRGGARDVSWTRRKWVQKFRGAHAGQVQLAERKTLRVRPDPERLARLRGKPRGP